jgi:DNA-binding beta-propeller fold protein YncE
MDSKQFDRWTRHLESRMTRRGVSALTAGLAAAGLFSLESEAKKKKKKKKSKAKNVVPVSPPPPPPASPPVSPPPSSCTRQCAGKECGPDNCGGVCGTCGNGEVCTAQGQCLELEVYELDLTWGEAEDGTVNDFIDSPSGLAVDSDGKLYVADNDRHHIVIFRSNGEWDNVWGDSGFEPGELSRPGDLALDSAGFLYEVDAANRRIQKFTRAGEFITTWGDFGEEAGEFRAPSGVAVDSAGNVFVTDSQLHRIQKFSKNAADPLKYDHVWSRGSEGSGAEQFLAPSGVAVDSTGKIYVTDSNNRRVQILSTDGAFLGFWGTTGSTISQFAVPGAIAIDAVDRLYVGFDEFSGIQKYTTAGQFLGRWGRAREDDVSMAIRGIAVDSDGGVYVSEDNFAEVQKYVPVTNRQRSASTKAASHPERRNRRNGKQRKARGRHRARG